MFSRVSVVSQSLRFLTVPGFLHVWMMALTVILQTRTFEGRFVLQNDQRADRQTEAPKRAKLTRDKRI